MEKKWDSGQKQVPCLTGGDERLTGNNPETTVRGGCDFYVKSRLVFSPQALLFTHEMEVKGHSRIHSGICPSLKQNINLVLCFTGSNFMTKK